MSLRVIICKAEIHFLIIIFKGMLSLIDEAIIAQVCNKFGTKLWCGLGEREFVIIIICIA